jgi:hypothetical protein
MGLRPPPRLPRPKRPIGMGSKPVVCEYCDSIFGKETECRNCGAPRPFPRESRDPTLTMIRKGNQLWTVPKTSSTGPR